MIDNIQNKDIYKITIDDPYSYDLFYKIATYNKIPIVQSGKELFLIKTIEKKIWDNILKQLNHYQIPYEKVSNEERKLITNINNYDTCFNTSEITCDYTKLNTPINIKKRYICIEKDLKISNKLKPTLLEALLKFKITYEMKNGYDILKNKKKAIINSNEFPSILFDIQTFRGKKMIDIGFGKNIINLIYRKRFDYIIDTLKLLQLEEEEAIKLFGRIEAIIYNYYD